MLKLSFILPCYNVAPYIGRCIESIEQQDIPQAEYEIICVDDCSKDNTVEVIKEYQKQYSNIRLICHTENKTAGGARNTGMDAAKGEYLWFVDPDDAIVPDKSSELYESAHKNDLDILVFNYSQSFDGSKIHEIHQIKDNTRVLSGQDFFLEYFPQRRMAEVVAIWRQLYKRKFCVTKPVRYPEIKSSQDVVFAWTAFLKADRICASPINGYITYRRSTSTTGSVGRYKAINLLSTSIYYTEEISKLLENQPMYEAYRNDLIKDVILSVNDETCKLFSMSLKERNLYMDELRRNSALVDKFHPHMNRRSKVIYNYRLPKWLWNIAIYGYKKYDVIFRKRKYML